MYKRKPVRVITRMRNNEKIMGGRRMKYEIVGEPLPVVTCHVSAGETLITERGSMSWMSPNMKMETSTNGGVGKALGRMFSGDSLFQNKYTAMGGEGLIAFASSFPGSIRVLEIGPGNNMIVQKSAFLASEAGVVLSLHFQENRCRLIRRRRLYYAEIIRTRSCIHRN